MTNDLALPVAAERFMPHRKPMRLVDTLISHENLAGTVETEIDEYCIFLDEAGKLEPVTLAELMAQSYAVVKGYSDILEGRPVKEGFLVGLKKVSFQCPVFAGDRLQIEIKTVGSIDGFALAEGKVLRGHETVAFGTFKIWIP